MVGSASRLRTSQQRDELKYASAMLQDGEQLSNVTSNVYVGSVSKLGTSQQRNKMK